MGRAPQKSPAPRRLVLVAAVAAGLGLAAAGCSAGQITQTDQQVAAVNGAQGQAGDIAVRDAQLLFPVAEGYYHEGDDAPVVVVIANNGTAADKLVSVTADIAEGGRISGDAELEPNTAIQSGADQDDQGTRLTTTPHGSSSGSAHSTATATTTPSADSSGQSGAPQTTGRTGSTSGTSGSTTGSTTGSATGTTGSSVTGTSTPTSGSSASPTSSAAPSEPGKVKITLKGLTKDLRPGQTLRVTFLFEKAGQVTLDLPIGASPEPRKDEPAEH
ncbi:hypothetical protein ABZ816_07290 [Actinosynnema sp. NPDC047251]|uniref:Secreted protein n=1 Tax=Saccharothrix espanaensis (strain ATCC 51144 / DSM 44229 / JCM 9112 / NBRC 15066 / NRRL 15764) TaxID=1179773 RepID=K0JSC7_SACES|nr:hypothetical protein [Saccharothrix espanaensis]CCH27739.1 hypothetical protein BN6_04080 [Saccharothrix espanaensis DSM 44229]